MLIARGLGVVHGWRRRWADFPGWPLDLSSDFLADLSGHERLIKGPTPVFLTHDIDSPEGLVNLSDFMTIEERYGAHSCNYVVPCAWPVDAGALAEVAQRGHEIGVHGFDHSNRTPFVEPMERAERLARGAAFGAEWGAVGYRAPSLVRNRALLDGLQPYYRYDSSIPTSGGPFPVLNNGSATARPYRIGALWEFPLSMPRDGSLRFLGYGPEEIVAMWLSCADRIARAGGIVCLLTHCETSFSGNPAMLAAYEKTIATLAGDKRYTFTLPRDLAVHLDKVRALPISS
jgi:peptidoglycan/xylan/chitin deacetylase (PgdA/CDA1 family)